MAVSIITPLSDLTCIAVLGEKAESFLQGQLTCDVREINETQTRRAAHCTPKGRVLSSMRVFKLNGKFYLLLPQNMADATIKELKKYAMLSRVSLEKSDLIGLGCYGAEIKNALLAELDELPKLPDSAINKDNLLVIAVQGDAPRYEIISEPALLEKLYKKLPTSNLTTDNNIWKRLDIQNGIAHIYPTTTDMFTPHMLNYPALNAVSFKKGCYIGQEIIARTHYLGKAKRHLYLATIRMTDTPNPGDIIYNGSEQEVGVVIDAAIENDTCYLLAVMQEDVLTERLCLKGVGFNMQDLQKIAAT